MAHKRCHDIDIDFSLSSFESTSFHFVALISVLVTMSAWQLRCGGVVWGEGRRANAIQSNVNDDYLSFDVTPKSLKTWFVAADQIHSRLAKRKCAEGELQKRGVRL